MLLFLVLMLLQGLSAQGTPKATDSFVITGDIQEERIVTLENIESLTARAIDDLVITNHRGEARSTATGLYGIPIKELLQYVELKAESPKEFSAFYFVFTALDGYTVVYSWNELFNNPMGNEVYVVTQRDGKTLREMEERILILNPSDLKTGRRHIKALHQITVRRAE